MTLLGVQPARASLSKYRRQLPGRRTLGHRRRAERTENDIGVKDTSPLTETLPHKRQTDRFHDTLSEPYGGTKSLTVNVNIVRMKYNRGSQSEKLRYGKDLNFFGTWV